MILAENEEDQEAALLHYCMSLTNTTGACFSCVLERLLLTTRCTFNLNQEHMSSGRLVSAVQVLAADDDDSVILQQLHILLLSMAVYRSCLFLPCDENCFFHRSVKIFSSATRQHMPFIWDI